MNIFQKKSGASLLTILLLISVVGVMVLAGSRALQETSRAAAVLSTRDEARQIAMTGVMEALGYVKGTASSSYVENQYGQLVDRTSSTSYSLNPLRRGFSQNSSCLTQSNAEQLTASSSTIDKSCPYYDMSIRDRAAYTTGQTPLTNFGLSSRDFANGTPVVIPLRATQVDFYVVPTAGLTGATFALCTTIASCGAPSGTIVPNAIYPVRDNTLTYRYVQITASYSAYPTTPVSIITAQNSIGQVVIGKGYKTIDVTAYSGETQVHTFYTIRAGQAYVSDFAGTFDQYGILK